MKRLVYKDRQAGGVWAHTYYDDVTHEVTVEHVQDAQAAVDLVDTINAEGAPTIDGLGKPVVEVPVVLAMEWAEKRGIPWEKLLYSNEYDAEFKRFAQVYTRLQYKPAKSVHAV